MYSRAAPDQSFFSICLPTLSLDYLEISFTKSFSDSKEEKSYYLKLTTDTNQRPRYCFLTAKYNDEKIVGYSFIVDPTESAFYDSILSQKVATYLIHCKSVKKSTIKYIAAESSHHKEIDLLSTYYLQ
jgi:hypothetical protein